jgi:hypothetical protein
MYSRGSEWREWDLHIHSPASFHWNGERFGTDRDRNSQLIDDMIRALNEAAPVAFGLMVRTSATIGGARVPIQIDVGFGDVITPRAVDISYSTLLDGPVGLASLTS